MKCDLLIGGAGLYGAVLAHFANKKGRKVVIVENKEIGGMCADADRYSKYGPHIFHTKDRFLWEWVNSIDHFIPIHHSPLVIYKNEMYSFPINKLTMHQLKYDWTIQEPRGRNFEEACIYSVGETLYEKFFYHYTKKMWGRDPKDLPVSLFSRVPVRTDYNTSYFNDRYSGVPVNGYSLFISKLLDGVQVIYGDFCKEHKSFDCKKVFTGSMDEFFDYKLGRLEYRGLLFDRCDPIDAATINYTDDRPITRRTNYKYINGRDITIEETPVNDRRFYPVPWGRNLYNHYKKIKTDVEFSGRLGSYEYLNMDTIMERAYHHSTTL